MSQRRSFVLPAKRLLLVGILSTQTFSHHSQAQSAPTDAREAGWAFVLAPAPGDLPELWSRWSPFQAWKADISGGPWQPLDGFSPAPARSGVSILTSVAPVVVGTFSNLGTAAPQPQTSTQSLYVDANGGTASSTAVYVGATYNVSASDTFLNVLVGTSSQGTLNQNAGTFTVTSRLIIGSNAGSTGTYNLNGGVLNTYGINLGSGSGAFNFNGGTLQAGSTAGNFFVNSRLAVNASAGGATVDTNGLNMAMGIPLLTGVSGSADGGITKVGAGTLSMTGANTYTGPTNVNVGTLQFIGTGGSSGGGRLALSGTGALIINTSGTVAASGVTLTNTATSLTLQSGVLQIADGGAINSQGPNNGLIFNGGTLRAAGTLTLSSYLPISIQAGCGTVDTAGGNVTSSSAFGYSGGAAGNSAGMGTFTVQGGHTLKADFGGSASGWAGSMNVTGTGTTLQNNVSGNTFLGALNVDAGAFFDLNNLNVSAGGLTGAGTILNTGGAGAARTVTLTGAGSYTFSGAIAPTGGATEAANTALTLNLGSGGVQILSGANTYTGATTISAGTLQIGAGGTSGSLGTSAVIDNGTLAFNRTDAVTFANAVSGTGGLTQAGAGTTTLTGNNTLSGPVTISAGTLQVGAGSTAGSLGTGAVTDNAALVFNRSDAVTIGSAVSGTGSLTQAGTGTTVLTGANTYSGATTVSAGTLQVGNGGTGATLGTGNVVNNAALFFNHSDAVTVAGVISGTGGLTQAGSGTLTLSGNNTFSGATTISAGVLNLASYFALSGSPLILSNAAGSGTLTFDSSVSVNAFGVGGLSGSGNLALVSNAATPQAISLSIGNHGATSTYSGILSGSGSLSFAGGTLILTGANTYTGTTMVINSGTLQIGDGGTAGTLGTGPVTDNAALVFNRSDNVTVANVLKGTQASSTLTQAGSGVLTLTGANTYAGTMVINSGTLQIGDGGTAGTLGTGPVTDNAALVFNRSDNVTVANVVSGMGSLTQAGGGTLTLTGANTYTGATTISTGTLQVGSGGTTGGLAAAGTITDNATLAFNRSNTITQGTDFSSGPIGGTGGVTKLGAGTLALTVANTYTGATTISAGTLQVGNGGTTGGLSTSSTITDNATLAFNRSNAVTQGTDFGGPIGGTGGVTKLGAGTLTLNAANTYTGTTLLAAGILQLGSAGALGTSGNITFTGGTLQYTANNLSDYSGRIVNSTGSIRLDLPSSRTVTLASALPGSNTGGLILTGQGTLTLTGANTYGGNTVVNTGSFLQVGSGGTSGTLGTGAVVDNGSLALNRSDNVTVANAISGTGGLGQNGRGTSILTGANTFTGVTVIRAGALQLGNGGTTGKLSPSSTIVDNTALVFNRSNAVVQGTDFSSDVVSGTGSLTQAGTGTLTLTAANTYTGVTTINSGTLQLGNGGTTGTLATDSVITDNGTLAFNRSDVVVQGTDFNGAGVSGTGNLVQAGSGTLTLTAANTYTGTTTISAGTLQVGNGGTLGTGSVVNNAALVFNRSDAVTVANAVSGTGGLTQAGTGTTTLTGNNTFSGPVNVNAGTLAVASEAGLGAATNTVTIAGGAQLQFTGNSTLTRNYNLGMGTLAVAAGQTATFGGNTVNYGRLVGPGTAALGDGTTFNSVRVSGSAALSQGGNTTVSFNDVTLSGSSTYTQAAGATLNTAGDFITTAPTSLMVSGTVNLTAGGSVSGALTVNNGGVVATSSAPLYLDGSRGTTVNAGGTLAAASGASVELGGLLVNNGTQSGTLNVGLGGVARGSGTFGSVNVGHGGYFGPNALTTSNAVQTNALTQAVGTNPAASAPAATNVASLTLGSGSVLSVSLQDARGAAGSGYDTAQVQGALTLGAYNTAGDQITVSLASLGGNGVAGSAANFDPGQSYTFVLATSSGISGFAAANFAVDTSGFQNGLGSGHFFVAQDGNNLDLNFTPVPEPATWLGGALLAGAAGFAVRRRWFKRLPA